MATDTARTKPVIAGGPTRSRSTWDAVRTVLAPIASLKLTVLLLFLAIGIVLIGTLAQTEKNIWQVIHDYFRMDLSSPSSAMRTAFAWVEYKMLFPASFFPQLRSQIPEGGFFYPNGWLIGFIMFLNLTTAHLIRFRLQAKGPRLFYGVLVTLLGGCLVALLIVAGSMQTADRVRLFIDWPSLRILWLLIQCTLVSVVLFAGLSLLFRKRAGIVLIHSGIGLLMLGELIVGVAAVESQMRIVEGDTVNYAEDTRDLELAVIDTSDPREDDVLAIPQSRLRRGQVTKDELLPFDVKLVKFYPNSNLRQIKPNEENLATVGTGLNWKAVDQRAGTGTDTGGTVDLPAAYVTIINKQTQEIVGTHLVSLMQSYQDLAEKVQVGDVTYDLYLRFKRIYKPYSMHLIDVRFDPYMGTQTAKSYSSELRLVDPERNVDRKVKIWMNNPLRFSGETFYQSSYNEDPATRLQSTGLQVVTNTGWRIPYVSCMMVVVGLFAQFGQVFIRFIRRRQNSNLRDQVVEAELAPAKPTPTSGNREVSAQQSRPVERDGRIAWLSWAAPVFIVLLSAGWLMSKARVPSADEGTMDLVAFGRLPVMYEGRIKPMDTLARNSLRILSDKQTFVDDNDEKQPAIKWLLDMITNSPEVRNHRVFRIHSLEVLDTLGLKARKGFRYSLNDISPKIDTFEEQVVLAHQNDADSMSLYQKKILELDKKLRRYLVLRDSFTVPPLRMESLKEDIAFERSRRARYANIALPLLVPPENNKAKAGQGDDGPGEWQPYSYAEFDDQARSMIGQEPASNTLALRTIFAAYAIGDANAFNTGVADYRESLEKNRPKQWSEVRTDFEAWYNHFSPFFYSMILYMFAFVLVLFAWLGWSLGLTKPLNRAALCLILFVLVVHTFGLIARMYISGRPPVTNLYSSAIFIGWGTVIFGIVLEFLFRKQLPGIGNMLAAATGFLTLMVAFLLTTAVPSFKGDTFTVLVAVLDTQFWLATHVTCVTLGYSATFVAGFLGIVYVFAGLCTPLLTAQASKTLARMIYGVICFALFFSFFGTVLGGLWADDSWGRFWGWDPKENGALIIVLWNALILHARWDGMVKDRGLAVLAIGGNVATSWSWFGVNELGIGLHSYGFTEGVLMILGVFVATQLFIFVVAGLIPKRYWFSSLAADE